jgi:3-hydroxyacyl-[acyl-carrier-protein] dehydratase
MRFLFYDRVTAIDKGKQIKGLKTFSLSEEMFRGHFNRKALVPNVIYIEAMAQLLGWGIIHAHNFTLTAILSLVEGVTIQQPLLRPGFTARITGEIVTNTRRDSLGRAWIDVDGDRVATLDRIIFTHYQQVDPGKLADRFCYYSGWSRESLQVGADQ